MQAEAFGLMAQATASLADMFHVKDHAVAALLMQHMVRRRRVMGQLATVGPRQAGWRWSIAAAGHALPGGANYHHGCCVPGLLPAHHGLATNPTCRTTFLMSAVLPFVLYLSVCVCWVVVLGCGVIHDVVGLGRGWCGGAPAVRPPHPPQRGGTPPRYHLPPTQPATEAAS